MRTRRRGSGRTVRQPPNASTAFRGDGGGGAACFSRSSPSTNVSVNGLGAAAMVLNSSVSRYILDIKYKLDTFH